MAQWREMMGVSLVGGMLVLGGCEKSAETHIGHWTLDTERMEEEIRAQAEAEGADGMAQFAISFLSKMEVDLHIQPGGTFEAKADMFGKQDHAAGSWVVTPDGIVMTPETKNGVVDSSAKPIVVKAMDRNHLRADGDGDMEMIFVRVDE